MLKKHKDKEYESILDILISHEIDILYICSQIDNSQIENWIIEFKNSSNLITKNSIEKEVDFDCNLKEEQKYKQNNENLKNENDQAINSSQIQIFNYEYDEVFPRRFTSSGEYFKNEHAVEIMFRSRDFSEQEETEVIVKLYGNFKNIGRQDSRLIKLLTIYNKI